MKKLLITGGSGFVGGHVVNLAAGKWEVHATYHDAPFTFPGVHTFPLDLADESETENTFGKIGPDVVIHTAARSNMDLSQTDPDRTFAINEKATRVIARLSRNMGFRLVFTSTDMVFDGEKGRYRENDVANPISVYGEAKWKAEEAIRDTAENYAIARVALVYGTPVTGSNSFSEKIMEKLRQGMEVPLFTDQIRSPILVETLAEALLELAESDYRGAIHLGGEDRVDRYTFGLFLCDIAGLSRFMLKPVVMSDMTQTAPRPRDTSFDISLAKKILKTRFLGYREGLMKAYGR